MKSSTLINKETIMQFNFYHNSKSLIQKIIVTIAIILTISSLYGFIKVRDLSKLLFTLIFIFIIGLCNIFNKWFVKFKFRKIVIEEIINTYEFFEDYYLMDNIKYDYNKVKKIAIDKEYVYMYLDKNKAFIVNKRDIDINRLKNIVNNAKINKSLV